ncbi:MAG: toll/interleukin-1 receptor domain-containing protein, partial [Lachnospiraceae bacterium]|nr:toll/interleukin-1 receptor domain-containing protein [Lachnospiraceae bacterium]
MNYTGLQYKTRGNVNPQGRPRIYFCCHEADFEQTFESITEEILKITTYAAFWYYDPANGIPDGELFISDLGLMQLFVIPVTAKFLERGCRARAVEMQFAIDHHIPVLPLMLDPGLERDFNHICGDLQILDRSAGQKDPTEIPYKEKLTKFLGDVLIPDQLAKKVREAFDTHIFLSYRKKDRIHAQQIMRQIHASESCQDIAIWYDEFLIPGENFNDSIAAVMDKCDLLALVVTPNLLENPNYIMTTEYPMFHQSGKPILPIEALATDNEKLSQLYKGIRSPLPPDQAILQMTGMISNDTTRINETVRNRADRSNYSDFVAMHNFLIGLAFLYGIEVEVDKDRALKLILSSAEAGIMAACKKLADMYINGEAVAHSYESAIVWQKKLVDLLQDSFDEEPTENNLNYLIPEARKLSMLYLAAGDTASAEETNTFMQDCVLRAQSPEDSSNLRNQALYYKNLGDI